MKSYITRFTVTFMHLLIIKVKAVSWGRVEYDMNNKWSSHHWHPIHIKYRVDYDLPFSEYQFDQ